MIRSCAAFDELTNSLVSWVFWGSEDTVYHHQTDSIPISCIGNFMCSVPLKSVGGLLQCGEMEEVAISCEFRLELGRYQYN